MERIIRKHADIAELRRYAMRYAIHRIKLDADVSGPHLESLVNRINRGLRSCGCFTAAGFCVASLATLPWLAPFVRGRGDLHWVEVLGVAFAYVLSAALTGKIVGLIVAQVKVVRDLDALGRHLHPTTQFHLHPHRDVSAGHRICRK